MWPACTEPLRLLRARDPALLAALAWWGFDLCTLWACFHAFGETPQAAVVVMGYFTGMLGNVLPTPAGLGGVEGGMIAAFVGFGVDGGLAVAAVLGYRAFRVLDAVDPRRAVLRPAALRERCVGAGPE